MGKRLLPFFLSLLAAHAAHAQLGKFSDAPVEITADGETRFVGGVAVAERNVVIRYGTAAIYCDYAEYNPDTRDVLVKGNVRFYSEGHLLLGERAVYNLETKQFQAADFRGDFYPMLFSADSVRSEGEGKFWAGGATFTTSDSSKPDYYLRAKTVRIYPRSRVIFSDVTLYVGRTPIFWWPYLYQSLRKDLSFGFSPGSNSVWGAFLLSQFTFPVMENATATAHLDLRSKRGVGLGLDSDFKFGKDDRSWGRFRSYYIDDQSPQTSNSSLPREPIDGQRYRVQLQGRAYIADDFYASVDVDKISDTHVLEDFFFDEFGRNPQPQNVLSLTRRGDDYAATLIARAQFNRFFDTTERLPEAVLDIKRFALFESPIFYEGETGIASLRRNYEKDSPLIDYSAVRFDSFHQLLYPQTYFGWLSLTPRAGFRGTYYSAGAADASGGDIFRPVFNAGVELAFKLSRTYDDLHSSLWGLDGLRHIVQPYTELSYVSTGRSPSLIPQFDRINPSSQRPPIDFPAFNSIDAITDWDILRLGVRNRFQTRRDSGTFNWLTLDSFVDVNLQQPGFPNAVTDTGRFSNLFNKLTFQPLPWVALEVDSQLPVFDRGFTEVNTGLSVMLTRNISVDFGHRYIDGNPFFQNSSLFTFGGYLRINDNWGFSLQEQYEAKTGTLEYQRYEVHRDLSSWVASLGFVVGDNGESKDYGVLLTFTLKDLPQLGVPFSFVPYSTSTAAGRNP
jgi:lipopolysaccharide export system protein LptA